MNPLIENRLWNPQRTSVDKLVSVPELEANKHT